MGLPDLSDLTAGTQGSRPTGGGLPALDDLLRGETDSAPKSPAVGTQRTIPKTGNPVLDFALGHSRPGVGVQDVQASAEAWKPTFDILADPLKNEAPWYQRAGRAALNNLPAPLTWADELYAWVAQQAGSPEAAQAIDRIDEAPPRSFESDAQQAVTNTMMSGPSRVFAPMFAQARGQEQTANPTLFGAAAPRWEDLLPEARTGEQVITDLGRPEQYSEWESLLTGGEAALWQFASDPTNLIDVIAAARGLKGMRAQRAAEELLQREAVATRAREMTDAADARATSYADLAAAERARQAQELEAARVQADRLPSQADLIRQRYGDAPAGTTPEAALEQRLRAEEQARRQAESEARSAEMLAERQRQLDAERRLRGEAPPEPGPLRGPAGELTSDDALLGAPEDLAPPAPQAPASPLVIPGRTGGGELVLPPSSGPRNVRSRVTVDAPAPEVVPEQAGVPSRVRPGDSYTSRDGVVRFEVAEVLPRHPNPDPNNPFHLREADLPHVRVLVFDPRSRVGPVEILQPLQNVERAVLWQRRPAPAAAPPEAPAAARPAPEPAPAAPQSLADLQQQTARGIGAMQDAERARRQQPRWSKSSSGPAAVLEAPAPPRPVELAPAPPPATRQGGIEVVRQERGPVRSRQTVDAPAPPRPEPLTPARAQARDVVSGRAPSQPALPSVGEVPFSVRGANFLAREGPNGRTEVVAVQNRGRQVPVTAPGAEVLKAAEAALAERRANPVREGVAIPMDEGTPVSPPERPKPTPDPDDEIPVYLRPFVREGRRSQAAAEFTQAGGPGKPRVTYRALPEDDGGVRVQKKLADGRWVDVPNPTPSNLALAKAALKKKGAAPAAAPSKPATPKPTVAPGAQVTINNPNMVTHGQKGEVLRRAATDAPDGTPMWHVQVGKKQVVVAEDSLRVRQAAPAATPEPTPTPEPEPAPAAAAEPTPTPEPDAPAETPVPKQGGGGTRQQRQAAAPDSGPLESRGPRKQGGLAATAAPTRPATQTVPGPPGPTAPTRVTTPAPAPGPRKNGKPPKSQADIVRDLAKGITRITYGRLKGARGVLGRFLDPGRGRNVVEIKKASDYKTTYHEVGHAVQEAHELDRNFSAAANASLDTLGTQGLSSWQPGMSAQRKRQEGFAEMLRLWLEDPSSLRRQHPELVDDFEAALDDNPTVGNVLKKAYADMRVRERATPQQLIRAEVVDEALPSNSTRLLDMVEKVFDDLVHLEMASEGMAASRGLKELPASEDIHLQAKLLRGTTGHVMDVLVGERNPVTGTASGGQMRLVRDAQGRLGREVIPGRKSLIGILDQVGDDPVRALDFRDYLLVKRAEELHGRGIETPFQPAHATATVRDLEARHGDFDRIARELYEWQDSVLEYARDSGLLSTEAFDRIKALSQAYVPFHRVYEVGAGELPEALKGTGGGLLVGSPDSLKRMKGSARQIVDPIQSILRNTHALIVAAEKNQVGRALADLWDNQAQDMGKFLGREVEPPVELQKVRLKEVLSGRKLRQELEQLGIDIEDYGLTNADLRAMIELFPDKTVGRQSSQVPWGENIVRVKDGDKWRFFQLKPEVYRAWAGIDGQAAGSVARFLGRFAAVKRFGVVQNVGFIIRNLIRDPITSAIVSDRIRLVPGETLARGIWAYLRKPQLVEQWANAGGKFATRTAQFSDRDWARGVAEVMRGMSPTARKLTWAPQSVRKLVPKLQGLPSRAMALLEKASQWSEEVNRLGAFDAAMDQYAKKNPGASQVDLTQKAAYETRDLMDFSLRGTATRQLKGIVPFFQPTLTGTYRFQKAMRRDPLGTVMRGLTWVTAPTVTLYLLNRNDKDYWQIEQAERDRFWHIRLGPGPEDFLRIPKPHLEGFLFGTMMEKALQWADKNDPKAFDEIVQDTLEGALPVQFIPVDKTRVGARILPVPSSFGPIGDTLVHLGFNYNPYSRRQIDSDFDQKSPTYARYSDYTSATSKWLGKSWVGQKMGVSPNMFDDAIYTMTGGTGSALVRGVADPAVSAATGIERPTSRPRTALEHAGLQKKSGRSESENRLRDYVERLEQEQRAAKDERRPFRDKARLKQAQGALKQVNDWKKQMMTEQDPAKRERLLNNIRRVSSRITPPVGAR